uniref:Uncharacterized protein n=1 Tax=Acrobeloides nanus TaxID=290746 RepID=A0A914EA36_9BILA
MPAYVSGNGLVYDSLKSIKIDCCIDVPCAYDMEAFLNVCQGLTPSMGNLTWIIPESPKLGYDRFCKVLRNLQEAPQIQRIVEKANVNGVGLVKTIVFIGNIAYEILKVTRYPLCYIVSGPTVKICYLIDDNRITMNIQDLSALAEKYKFDFVFMKIDLRREAADEIFKVHEILRPKKTIYIIPYAFKCEMDVNKIHERLESRCRFDSEISINCFELLSCGKSYSNRLILNEPDKGTTSTRRSRPRGFYNPSRGYMYHSCMENHSDEPRNQTDEDETNVIEREAGWLLGMTSGSVGFI